MKTFIAIMALLTAFYSYAQTVTIGITGSHPPYNSRIDLQNHFSGFDVELMDEICKRMNAHCQYLPMIFSELFTSIDNNKIDLAIDSIIITPEREHQYLFSIPYLTSRVRFVTTLDSSIKTINDIKNKNIAVRSNSPFEILFTKLFNNEEQVTPYNSTPDMINALGNNKVDAILIDNIAAEYWVSNNSQQFKLIGSPLLFGKGFGIMSQYGQKDLMTKINEALQQMQADGTYKKIYSHYFAW